MIFIASTAFLHIFVAAGMLPIPVYLNILNVSLTLLALAFAVLSSVFSMK